MYKQNYESGRSSSQAGFTLIEIMLVVIIIGILAGVAAVKFSGKVGKGQTNAAKASIHAISMAISLYEMDNGKYPPNLEALITAPGGTPLWDGPYLEDDTVPRDPWSNEFRYLYPSSRGEKFYDLKSLGLDGVDSADDVTK